MIKKGFSLIELLIVIAIMAILGSLALSAFSTARKQARDVQRKQELNQYKTALEAYYADNSSYPIASSVVTSDGYSSGDSAIFYINGSIVEKYLGQGVLVGVNASDGYLYHYLGDGVNYKLWGEIEIPADDYWQICSNGRSGHVTSTEHTETLTCDPITNI